MINRSKIENLTGFNRRKVQEWHNIIAQNKNTKGVAYLYNDEEINKFLMVKFLDDCNYQKKDIESLLVDYSKDRKNTINTAIKAMELQIEKLKKNIIIANNMMNSNLLLLDVSKLLGVESMNFGYDVLLDVYNFFVQKEYSLEEKFNSIIGELNFENYVCYLLDAQDAFKKNTLDISVFRERFLKYIEFIVEKLGFLSSSIVESLAYKNQKFDQDFQLLVKEIVDSYLEQNKNLIVENQQNNILESLFNALDNNTFDSDIIQGLIDDLYNVESCLNKLGIDAMWDFEMRSKIFDSIVFRKNLPDDEARAVASYLAKAFKYYVSQKKKNITDDG